MFLKKKIRFIDISKILLKLIDLKEFRRYKSIKPKNIKDILELHDYVSLKIQALSV
jgi:1-deoxy-D-xylulose-5-phosphate reductoisomerase